MSDDNTNEFQTVEISEHVWREKEPLFRFRCDSCSAETNSPKLMLAPCQPYGHPRRSSSPGGNK